MASLPQPQQETPHPYQALIERNTASLERLGNSAKNAVTDTQCLVDKTDVGEIINIMQEVNSLLGRAASTTLNHSADVIPASAQFWHNAAYKAATPANAAFCFKEAYNHLVSHLYSLEPESIV